jgi:hypothetical protein
MKAYAVVVQISPLAPRALRAAGANVTVRRNSYRTSTKGMGGRGGIRGERSARHEP